MGRTGLEGKAPSLTDGSVLKEMKGLHCLLAYYHLIFAQRVHLQQATETFSLRNYALPATRI